MPTTHKVLGQVAPTAATAALKEQERARRNSGTVVYGGL